MLIIYQCIISSYKSPLYYILFLYYHAVHVYACMINLYIYICIFYIIKPWFANVTKYKPTTFCKQRSVVKNRKKYKLDQSQDIVTGNAHVSS